jgi:molybdate transport system substrate-binding protein
MAGVFRVVLLLLILFLFPRAGMADSLQVYAAGSLSGAFAQMVNDFPAPQGSVAPPIFGPSGVLRERIEHGDPADILASADMTQARKLATSGQPVIMFTRNKLCALGRPGLTTDNLLDRMLDPAVRLATSTPGADPGGDYAWAIFTRAETLYPGARAVLEAKALKLVGSPNTPPLVAGHGAVQGVFLADRADIMLGYCSGSEPVMKEIPNLVSVIRRPRLRHGRAIGSSAGRPLRPVRDV